MSCLRMAAGCPFRHACCIAADPAVYPSPHAGPIIPSPASPAPHIPYRYRKFLLLLEEQCSLLPQYQKHQRSIVPHVEEEEEEGDASAGRAHRFGEGAGGERMHAVRETSGPALHRGIAISPDLLVGACLFDWLGSAWFSASAWTTSPG